MKPWAEWFYKSNAWTECRYAFLVSKYFICERCSGAAVIAHHKIYLTPQNIHDPDITLNWDNLEALCQDCHNKEHHGDCEHTAKGLAFNQYGELVPIEQE